ncbi:MAG: 50S ribosomal protein L9 [Clostridia bacterium]|nr:50S ribosomal protein L9 [Clostridia bacterium]
MKVILLQDVKSQGKKGDVITVSDGYAANFLIPKKLAIAASAAALNEAKAREEAKQRRIETEKKEAAAIAEKLEASVVKLGMAGGSDERLYGSVTAKDIADALKEQLGIDLDKRKLVLGEQIKTYGSYTVEARLYTDIVGKVNLIVFRK